MPPDPTLNGPLGQTRIKPIDDFVRQGFAEKMQQQFRAQTIYTTSPDALAQLKAQLGNQQPQYPYIFLYIQSVSPNTDSYATHRLARFGVPVQINEDGKQTQNARVLPVNFEIEVTYVTNRYDGINPEAVNSFVRRWLFTRRNGSLNFTVDYGLHKFQVSYTATDSLQIPKRENPAEQESVYQVVANITVHGYVSEPTLTSRGRITQVVLADAPVVPGAQFFPFK